jgi:hypothetical protein
MYTLRFDSDTSSVPNDTVELQWFGDRDLVLAARPEQRVQVGPNSDQNNELLLRFLRCVRTARTKAGEPPNSAALNYVGFGVLTAVATKSSVVR